MTLRGATLTCPHSRSNAEVEARELICRMPVVDRRAALAGLGLSAALWLDVVPWAARGTLAADNAVTTGVLPKKTRPVGGRWHLEVVAEGTNEADQPRYFFDDGGQLIDLFSYHRRDSNRDGIDNLRISHDERFLIVRSQGYPNHPTAIFPNSDNPNTIRVQDFTFRFPLLPRLAEQITRLPMGPIGMALNGVVFFNPFEMEGQNAVAGYSEVWLDACCGHPQQTGVYHYHKYPSCVKSPFPDDGQRHSPAIGLAFDGFPVHGPYEAPATMAMTLDGARALDACNGHRDAERGYHYHVTPGRFPYILGGYAGEVEVSNNRALRRQPAVGPLQDNTQPGPGRLPQVIAAVRPGAGQRGVKQTVIFELTPANARNPLPAAVPVWAQIGPFEATALHRDGDIVRAEFAIPADAPLGVWLDCHLEFEAANGPRRTIAFKRNDVFRVVE